MAGGDKESPPTGHEEIGDALAIKLRRREQRGNRPHQFRMEIVAGLAAGVEEQSERRPRVLGVK